MNKKITLVLTIFFSIALISGTIDLNDLFEYSSQSIPTYISEDNTPASNPITDAGATLGRVLFYDKQLSVNNTISCASCHKQEFAFGDTATVSVGWDGETTGRHSPRLINARFGEEENFFWDERANSLEEQSTMPIHDHVEMGFSETDGNPGMDSLITKLEGLDYYQELFEFVYGDFEITEAEIQDALAQFVRSIQSFDSRYDEGLAEVANNTIDFPNFTVEENLGKNLFRLGIQNGGANCQTCHNAPEFDIDSNSNNNSVISVAGDPTAVDVTNTRSPTLRDMVNPDGSLNGPLMHDGSFTSLMDVIELYNDIPVETENTNLDNRLSGGPGNPGQSLNLNQVEKDALVAFLETLTGVEVYSAEQWSDPFDEDGTLTILNGPLPVALTSFKASIENRETLLEWTTSSEANNDGFEIQHSRDAVDWEKVDFVEGQGDSFTASFYDYIHDQPLRGINYYRLKQIDFDGKINFTNTLSVMLEEDSRTANVYPNPVRNNLYVELAETNFSASLMNSKGQILRKTEGTDQLSFDFYHLDRGVYYLLIKNGNEEEVRKIIKP